MNIITSNITDYLNNIKLNIKTKIFMNLNNIEYNKLYDYYINLIIYIYIHIFYPNSIENYIKQLELNNNRDLYAILNLLLPMIDDKNGSYELHKKIINLKDISLLKSNNEYEITKIQYDRFYYSKDHKDLLSKNITKEYEYKIEDIEHNYKLLLDTIDRISHKLYVNWNNIIPILKNNFNTSELYIKSFKWDHNNNNFYCISINNEKISLTDYYKSYENINKYRLEYNGINFMNYYNTIYYDLYLSIIDIKWILYEIYIINNDNNLKNKPRSYLQYINDYINLKKIYNNNNWFILEEKDQIEFENNFNKFIYININNLVTFKIIWTFLYNFEKIYKTKLINEYNYISYIDQTLELMFKKDTEIMSSFFNDEDINLNHIILNKNIQKDLELEIKKIPLYMIYQFISSILYKLDRTWYGKYIINNNNDNSEFISNNIPLYSFTTDMINIDNFNYYISFKNIYNFAKSLSLYYGDIIKNDYDDDDENINIKYTKYTLGHLKGDWYNLNLKKIQYFINYLITTKISLISISNYIRYTYIYNYDLDKKLKLSFNDINKIYNNVRNIILSLLKNIVFDCLIFRGLLSQFNFDIELTNNSYKDKYHYNMKKFYTDDYIKSIKKNSYYYLTDKLYNDLDYVEIDNDNKLNNKTFFDLIKTKYNWTRFYAMDWISQISFYHHYINNRMVMITGATGQGKSTQVPKLYLYSLKMIDHNYNGKIVCTVPRIMPVKNNADRISWELGVPIFKKSKHFNDIITTNNGYVQYKTSEDSHIITNNDYYLRLTTDGTLLQDILYSPLLKNINIDRLYRANKGNEYNSMSVINKYDIIIIDEAHEHNKNIDLLFTTLRYAIEYNNSLKLSIVSATMEDDEKLYRSYYNMINDNFLYPLNEQLKERELDRITVDRRIHISPPGETTQFQIIEKYNDYEPKNYEEAEEIALKILQTEILNKNIISDILIFSITEKKIIKLVDEINNKILSPSSKFICIPCYSALNEYWKNFITNISKELKELDIDRTDLMKYIYNKNLEYKKVQKGYYTNVIIVATNIAEASLTFDTVKYVIDTGYYINVNSSCGLQSTIVNIDKISDASRKQRKGRVGRVSNGNVYYTYTENSRIGNKPNYGICSSDISDDIYKLLVKTDNDEILININLFDDFVKEYNLYDKNIYNNFIITKKKYSSFIHQYIILDIDYDNHELNNVTRISYNYHGNKIFLKDRRIKENINDNFNIPDRYMSGYDISTLLDNSGLFYFIHPDEQSIERQSLRQINISENIFINRILECIIKNIRNNYLISINNNFTKDNIIKYYNEKLNRKNKNININIDVIRSNFSYIIDDVFSNDNIKLLDIKYSKSFMITLAYSVKYNCQYICIIMIILLHISNYKIDNLFNKNESINYNNDDLYNYYIIAKKIYDILIKNNIIKIYENCYKKYIDENNYIKQKNQCINKCYDNNDIDYICKNNCNTQFKNPNTNYKKCISYDYFINNRQSYHTKKKYYLEIFNNNIISSNNNLNINEYKIFKNIFDNQIFDNDRDYLRYISTFINNKNIKDILKHLLSSLNIKLINEFINNFNLILSIIKLENMDYFNWFKNNIIVIPTSSNNIYESIKYSFLYGFNNIISNFDNKFYILDFDNLLLYQTNINNIDYYKYNKYNIALDINNDNEILECNCLFRVNINDILITKFLDFNTDLYINKLYKLNNFYSFKTVYHDIFNDIIKNYDNMKYKLYIKDINIIDDKYIIDIYDKSNDLYFYLNKKLNRKNQSGGNKNYNIYKIKLSSLSKININKFNKNIEIYKINYPYIYFKHI